MNPTLTLSLPTYSSFPSAAAAFHPLSNPRFLPLPCTLVRTAPWDKPPFPKFLVKSSSTSSRSLAADPVPSSDTPLPTPNPLLGKIKSFVRSSLLIAATVSFVVRVNGNAVARAEVSSPPPAVDVEELPADVGGEAVAATLDARVDGVSSESVLPEFLGSNPESLDSLKKLLQQKLEAGEDREGLTLLERIVASHPGLTEYKFLLARLYSELGDTENARRVFDDILADNPLSFEALFENSLLMDRCGKGEAVISRLEEAVRIAEDEGKEKEARDVRLIIAQMEFLRKDVEGALRSYEELIKDDGTDFRPYFCKGMIFSLVGKDDEAKEMFRKYKELSPRKFDVEGYIRSPLSRVKVFGADETN
ncbi:hypothetical protein MLD38_003824 [Melastoma candidum]|uniref:Uncharacterized protein n=1 Tax=Melastoma candidum TaxID=119954 RepID=A0ACB9S308_9MYRT|nr:hypothetical protein MLD38_003824 [Melastoma candidum]